MKIPAETSVDGAASATPAGPAPTIRGVSQPPPR